MPKTKTVRPLRKREQKNLFAPLNPCALEAARLEVALLEYLQSSPVARSRAELAQRYNVSESVVKIRLSPYVKDGTVRCERLEKEYLYRLVR